MFTSRGTLADVTCTVYLCPYCVSGPWTCPLLSMEGQRALGSNQKYLNLCSEDERRSYGFGVTWGWVINDRIFIFGWTNPLNNFHSLISLLHHITYICKLIGSYGRELLAIIKIIVNFKEVLKLMNLFSLGRFQRRFCSWIQRWTEFSGRISTVTARVGSCSLIYSGATNIGGKYRIVGLMY